MKLILKLLFSFSNLIISAILMNLNFIDFKNPNIRAYWQPPDFVFGIVWPILYILFGIINLRIVNSNHNPASKTFYVMNTLLESIILNLWVVATGSSSIPDLIKYLIGLLILFYLNLLCHFGRKQEIYSLDRLSYYLYLPYSFWIIFALILNIHIVHKLST